MAEEIGKFTIQLEQEDAYAFRVKFDLNKAADVIMDEPPPLGQRNGPNASRMLAAAAANCLSASLMFCLAREDVPPGNVQTEVTCTMVRNEQKRMRVGRLDVRITAGDELLASKKLDRCMTLFEDFCVVTASIRQGIPVGVEVVNSAGELLHSAE
ncbi:MAG: osmotically inducible protein OsmC [gamma proteobacterium symbiont of Ctena orbiculata]|uniref:OsmC family protein n=1 Tax=Candidatus Thiodiazotropha taylori TaxID=2792791 RepID=A0A944QVJ6_9GAMM|nr:OsmC family protein [Candidatus Thiodiazotropha taylori]PUB89588.1 MAG: osmotically inducible protein OsmC [gamma proteobacterium symbiont of Ctena orbiculata]MBT2989476.1 OsmC family protein [Candidatus Thiodiazotropha taylori]MBT2997056.1 OsmC family protein [Candidatus Thiodiazotropha taylori]MBT3002918.1 OsmC family protein [Candidatus Thiodiazotropha taylori]